MLDLKFEIRGAAPATLAATPTLAFALQIDTAGDEQIHAILLRTQVQIEAPRRRYDPAEQTRLFDLFGPPPEWARTLRRLLWTQANLNVPGFSGRTTVELTVPCNYDLDQAVTKYFHGLTDGEVPLGFLFSGTVFYRDARGTLQVTQIPWEKEARFRMPITAWRTVMDHYYPNTAWIGLSRATADRLADYKTRAGLATWAQAVENLLDAEQRLGAEKVIA
jgi:hypothetical protein